jgi:hypothetical protein
MGNAASRTNYYLNEFVNPDIEPRETVFSVRLVLNQDAQLLPEDRLTLPESGISRAKFMVEVKNGLKPDQKILIRALKLLYIQNDLPITVPLSVENMFDSTMGARDDDSTGAHPDMTGTVKFSLPPSMRDIVPQTERCIYIPLISADAAASSFIGMEEAVLKPRTVQLPKNKEADDCELNGEFLRSDDVLVSFIIKHKDDLVLGSGDFYEVESQIKGERSTYFVQGDLLARVRRMFESQVFRQFRYTRCEDMALTWNLSDQQRAELSRVFNLTMKTLTVNTAPTVSFLMQVDYYVISPGSVALYHKENKLGI